MIFEKFIDNDLGQVSYIVACDETTNAFLVDSRRDINDKKSNFDEFITKLLRVGLDQIKGIVNHDFGFVESKYLGSSNIIKQNEVDDSYTNILLDKDCSNLGSIVHSSLSEVKELDFSKYKRVIFSCNYGYKSSAVSSSKSINNFYIMD